ncbi:MAG: hypothetical protein V3Q69_05275 [Burkholderia sp.]
MQTSCVRNSCVLPEIISVDAIAPSRSIYATTPIFLTKIGQLF